MGCDSLFGGGERDRTDDLLLAKQALSQLSYTPTSANLQSKFARLKFKVKTKRGIDETSSV